MISCPPQSETELIQRARSLMGQRLGDLAQQAGWQTPERLTQAKGWAGQLIEYHLGATAGSQQTQDFPELGVELKTLPIDDLGTPLETTYVCIVPLLHLNNLSWPQSNVYNKLQRVLWVLIDGRRQVPPAQRVVGPSLLWSPSAEHNATLAADWNESTEAIVCGHVQQLTARMGTYLQIRPKAAHGGVTTPAVGPDGQWIQTRPRGYYLKKEFTRDIARLALEQAYG